MAASDHRNASDVRRFIGPLILLSTILSAVCEGAEVRRHLSTAITLHSLNQLQFERNLGQSPPGVRFLARQGNAHIFLKNTSLQVELPSAMPQQSSRAPYHSRVTALSFELVNAQPSAAVVGLDLVGSANYFVGNDPSKWIRGAPTFRKVRYRQIYPGIDLEFYGSQEKLEYTFRLGPHSRVADISFHVKGAQRMALDADGDLLLDMPEGKIRLARPVAYQNVRGRRRVRTATYHVSADRTFSFRVPNYDPARSLIIDPVLSYATYYGGDNESDAIGIAVDDQGETYVVGTTFASNLPVKNGFQSSNAGSSDVFISKLDPSGSLVFSTYMGGSGFDRGNAIAVDTAGNAYITGASGSNDFPVTTGAFMTSCPQPTFCNTTFAAKILTDGTLGYSTLLGGSNDSGAAIAVDSTGSAFVTGTIASTDLPVVNAFQAGFPGTPSTSSSSAFVQKLSSDGSNLIYSTYLGGGGPNAENIGRGIAVDSLGSAYVVGSTTSPQFPTRNAIEPGAPGQTPNVAFLTKFVPDGSDIVYSTYLGGSGFDFSGEIVGDSAVSIAVDFTGQAYVTGTTASLDFPLTMNAYSTGCVLASDLCGSQVFALKLNAAGTGLVYSTFVGSGTAGGSALDASNNLYITGTTNAPWFPSLNGIQTTLQQGADPGITENAFVTRLDVNGLVSFSSFLGGEGTSAQGSALAVDGSANIYVAGSVNGASNSFPMDFPVLNAAFPEADCCGVNSGFIAKINNANAPALSLSPLMSPFVVLRNMGTAPLTLSTITTSSNFKLLNGCNASVGPGTSCMLTLTGTNDGLPSGSVTISSNAAGSPQTFIISKPTAGDLTRAFVIPSATAVYFPIELVGSHTASQIVTLRNAGNAPGTITSIQLNGADFSQSNNCAASIAPASFCTLTISFTPSVAGHRGANMMINYGDGSSTQIFLDGVGSQSAISSPASDIEFGTQYVGGPTPTRVVTLTNTSESPQGIGLAITGPFSQTNTCSAALTPHANCRVAISFHPTTNAEYAGNLVVAPATSVPIFLHGTGRILSDLAPSTFSLAFGSVIVGTSFTLPSVTLQNISKSALTISNVALSADYSQTNDCPASLASGQSCTVRVTFAPSALGDRSGTLSIFHSGLGSPQVLQLTGSGRTALLFNPSAVTFDNQKVGTTSGFHFLSISNQGSPSVTLTSISVSGDFAIAQNPCPSALPNFFGCAVQFTFTPTTTGLRTGTITVVGSDSPEPHQIPISGVGNGFGVATTTTLSSSSDPSLSLYPVTLEATVHPAAAGSPSGLVTFYGDGAVLGSGALASGKADLVAAFPTGQHSLHATYNGDNNFIGSSSNALVQTVTEIQSTLSVYSSLNPSTFGLPPTLKATVQPSGPVLATGTVDFVIDSAPPVAALLSSGVATITAPTLLPPGEHSVKGTYAGDANFLGSSSAQFILTIEKAPSFILLTSSPNPAVQGNAVMLSAVVSSINGQVPSGTIKFFNDGVQLGSADLNAGSATLPVSNLSSGLHTLVASYSGDEDFLQGQSLPVPELVNPAGSVATNISLVSSQPTLHFKELWQGNAAVTSASGTPSGSVELFDNGFLVSSFLLDAGGNAILKTNQLQVGRHSFLAIYPGDSTFAGSVASEVVVYRSPKPR